MHAAFLQPSRWSEIALVRLVLRDDQRAWAELIRRYRSLVYRCIYKVAQRSGLSNHDVEEIYGDVLVLLVRNNKQKLRVWDPAKGTKLGSWIGMISINAAYDYLRSQNRRPLLAKDGAAIESVDDAASPLEQLLGRERWNSLCTILQTFSDKDRTFVELYFRQGLEPEKVAARMQISLKTVYSKKHKIRSHLARCLEGLAGDNPLAEFAAAA